MIMPHIDPVFFRLGPLEFRWYGLMYIFGFILGYFFILAGVKQKKNGWTREDVADFVFAMAVGIIIGGRIGYFLFYNLPVFLSHPLKVFAIWSEGGMSFHGGLAGGILGGVYFIRKKKTSILQMADIVALALPLGLGFGRLGNFINGELYGRVTDMPWGIVFPAGGNLPRHPSQLYEAILEGPVIFLIIWLLGRKERPTGVLAWTFIALYGLFRFSLEFLREPDKQLGFIVGPFSMGQLLSFPLLVLGLVMVWWTYKKAQPHKVHVSN